MFGSGKCKRKKIGRKNRRKEKAKEMNIYFFTCLVIHGKFKGKKKKNSFSFVWLIMKKKSWKNRRKTKSTICFKWLSIY